MGRTVVAEEAIKSALTSSEKSQKLVVGLLVGQVSQPVPPTSSTLYL